MSNTHAPLSSAAATLGLAGGLLVSRRAGRRDLGGAVFAELVTRTVSR
jgi:hypothetical protein